MWEEELLWLLAKTIMGQVKKAFSLAKCRIQVLETKIWGEPPSQLLRDMLLISTVKGDKGAGRKLRRHVADVFVFL